MSRQCFLILSLVTAVLHAHAVGCQTPPKSSSVKSHRHIGVDKSAGVDIPEFAMVETSLDSSTTKENMVTSQNRKHDAFTVDDTRLFVLEKATHKIFEITGLPLEWRPFSNLTWADNQTLMFDRWSQPHYGVHYVVNVKSRKLLIAAPFGDKFYWEQQRPKNPKRVD